MSASDTSQRILSSNSTSSVNKYFNTSSQRLQRYIADIQKGFVIIVVAGAYYICTSWTSSDANFY